MSEYYMAQYSSIIPEYASICIHFPQYAWPWLNISVCPWICLKMLEWIALTIALIIYIWHDFEYASGIKYVSVLNISWNSYNNIIIIVTYANILEFLSSRFVYQELRKKTFFSFFNTSSNIKITKAKKLFTSFFFYYNDVRVFEVFKCIFKCKTAKMKLAKNIKNGFLSKFLYFLYSIILYQVLTLFKFFKISYVPH